MPPIAQPAVALPRKVQSAAAEPLRRRNVAPAGAWEGRRRLVHAALVFVTIVLFMDALVGDKGFMETLRARRQSRDLAASLGGIRRENAQLRELMRRLLEDPAAIESVAREDLGLVRPGEIVFIIKDEKPTKSTQ